MISGGWFDQNWIQIGYQLADAVAGSAYSFVVTTAICWLFHFIPFLRLRSNDDEEIVGIDEYWIGEMTHDYISLDREIGVSRTHGDDIESSGRIDSREKDASRNTSVTTSEVPATATSGLPGGSRVDA